MTTQDKEILDSFEIEMETKTKVLVSCQKEKGLNSCYPCKQLLPCNTRKEYVAAVYGSMSKGKDGGFEF